MLREEIEILGLCDPLPRDCSYGSNVSDRGFVKGGGSRGPGRGGRHLI